MNLRHEVATLANDARVTTGEFSEQCRRRIAWLFKNRRHPRFKES